MAQFPPESFGPLLEKISAHLKSNKQTVSVVETAAGGLISAALLSVPGASEYYKGGITAYTLPSRIAFSSWTEEMLKDYKSVRTSCSEQSHLTNDNS